MTHEKRHVGLAPGRRFEDRPAHGHSVARIDRHHRVAEPERAELRRRRAACLDPDDASLRSATTARLGDAEHAALSARAQDYDHVTGGDQPRDLRRRARDVERRQRDALGQVGRQLRARAAREENCLAVDVDLGARSPDGADAVDAQGGQRQRDERRDAVAHEQGVLAPLSDLEDSPEQHPAGPGDRVVLLAPIGDGS